ncbi:MAG: PEP-CTERM sorting domain-containing protein [Planctomycetes bacterium]|nr:PEP-CTERM sorting domain-containing protein [Planctomycetota bacterium]MCG2684081.1 PEP-CTERM sorting domain-containing protein [Planctomycetales bacterium]
MRKALLSRCVFIRILRITAVCLPAVLFFLVAVSSATADDTGFNDWDSIEEYTNFSDMQALEMKDGKPPMPSFQIPTHGENDLPGYKLLGVVLNNPGDMLNSTANFIESADGTMWQMGGLWQVFVQTLAPTDFGGAALWMGQNYGNVYPTHHPGNGAAPEQYAEATAYSYLDPAWNNEVSRVGLGGALEAGDIVEVRVRAGLFYKGKFNVNEEHDNDWVKDFDIVKIADGVLPEPQDIAISEVRCEGETGDFKFNVTRLTGAEHFQGALVRFTNVQLVDPVSEWQPNATVTITDGNGYYFPLKLGLNGFDPSGAPTGKFDVTGIFDQETSDRWDPLIGDPKTGYRLWTTRPEWVEVPEPGALALLAVGLTGLLAYAWRKRRR